MTSQSDLNLCNAVCMYACITAYKGISTEYNKVLTVFYRFTTTRRGGWVVRSCWVNFQCRGVLLIWLIVGQGLAALAVGAGGVVWTFLSFLSSFSLSLGDGPI